MTRPYQSINTGPYASPGQLTRSFGRMPLGLAFLWFAMLIANLSLAQDLNIDTVLSNLKEKSAALADLSFLLKGRLVDADGTEIFLEIDVQAIPAVPVLRAYFIQPDALADNFVVLDGNKLYNYLFVTNQATLFDSSDPEALGRLMPQDDNGNIFTLSLDLEEVFSGFRTKLIGYEKTSVGNVYVLDFENIDGTIATIGRVNDQVVDQEWYPYRLTYFHRNGALLFDLVFEDFRPNQGLTATEVTFIPRDVEIIDERR